MPFSATINLGTVGVAITSVKLYGCTGNSGGNCTGCTVLTGYENVSVSTFPLLVSGIPNGVTYIQAEALGSCSADLVKQCISISGIPGATPIPTMTPTPSTTGVMDPTPNPTATQTMTPTPSVTTATIDCYFYDITGDDGTSNRDAFDFSYTNCDGTVINSTVVNTRTRRICAQVDSVTTESGNVIISESMGVCTVSPPDPTPDPTATVTETPYYLLLSRCDAEPGTVTGWTLNAFTQSQIMIGNIFYSAGGYYYEVINYQSTPPTPAGTLEGTKSNDYTSCDQTPGHWIPPAPTPGQSILVHTGSTFGSTAAPCAMYESEIATNSTTLFLSGHTTPTNGDYAYDSNLCVTTFVGDGNYYASLAGSPTTKYTFTIGPTGYINNVIACGAIPTPDPTPFPTPDPTSPPLFGHFRSNPSSTYNGHCNDNQVTSATFYSTSSTIGSSMYNTTVYTDTNYTPWVGGGFYYAVSSDDTFNTNNPPYYSIKVSDNGLVESVQYISSCTSGPQEA